jgi:hypothetical protein
MDEEDIKLFYYFPYTYLLFIVLIVPLGIFGLFRNEYDYINIFLRISFSIISIFISIFLIFITICTNVFKKIGFIINNNGVTFFTVFFKKQCQWNDFIGYDIIYRNKKSNSVYCYDIRFKFGQSIKKMRIFAEYIKDIRKGELIEKIDKIVIQELEKL